MTTFNIACIILIAIISLVAFFNEWDTLISITIIVQFIAFNLFIKDLNCINNVPYYFGGQFHIGHWNPVLLYQVTYKGYAIVLEAILILIWAIKLIKTIYGVLDDCNFFSKISQINILKKKV